MAMAMEINQTFIIESYILLVEGEVLKSYNEGEIKSLSYDKETKIFIVKIEQIDDEPSEPYYIASYIDIEMALKDENLWDCLEEWMDEV